MGNCRGYGWNSSGCRSLDVGCCVLEGLGFCGVIKLGSPVDATGFEQGNELVVDVTQVGKFIAGSHGCGWMVHKLALCLTMIWFRIA